MKDQEGNVVDSMRSATLSLQNSIFKMFKDGNTFAAIVREFPELAYVPAIGKMEVYSASKPYNPDKPDDPVRWLEENSKSPKGRLVFTGNVWTSAVSSYYGPMLDSRLHPSRSLGDLIEHLYMDPFRVKDMSGFTIAGGFFDVWAGWMMGRPNPFTGLPAECFSKNATAVAIFSDNIYICGWEDPTRVHNALVQVLPTCEDHKSLQKFFRDRTDSSSSLKEKVYHC